MQSVNASRFKTARPPAKEGYGDCGHWDSRLDENGDCAGCRVIRKANQERWEAANGSVEDGE